MAYNSWSLMQAPTYDKYRHPLLEYLYDIYLNY